MAVVAGVAAATAETEFMAVVAGAAAATAETEGMVVDVEAVVDTAVDSPTTREAMAAAVAAMEAVREAMGVAATRLSKTHSHSMYSTNAEHQVFSVFCHYYQKFPYLNYSHLLLYRHLLPTSADLQLISH